MIIDCAQLADAATMQEQEKVTKEIESLDPIDTKKAQQPTSQTLHPSHELDKGR